VPNLIISEYIEGTGMNRAIEITNVGNQVADLALCMLEVNFEGGASVSGVLSAEGLLAPGQSHVVVHPEADAALLEKADSLAELPFDGDDTLALLYGGDLLDTIGTVLSPGPWTSGGVTTRNSTLRRKDNVCVGNQAGFIHLETLAMEWEAFPQDNGDDLGSSVRECPAADLCLDHVTLLDGFHAANTNRDGVLSYEEIIAAFGALPLPEVLAADPNRDGIARAELLHRFSEDFSGYLIADSNGDFRLDLTELLRVIQLYNAGEYSCGERTNIAEDGYLASADNHRDCASHSLDANGDFSISLSELLRAVQLFNFGGYSICEGSEDGFCQSAG
jgi:hypothetical protein